MVGGIPGSFAKHVCLLTDVIQIWHESISQNFVNHDQSAAYNDLVKNRKTN